MPRLKRIRRKNTHRLEAQHFEELLTGEDFFGDAFGDDEEWRRVAWEKNREALTAYWANPTPDSWIGKMVWATRGTRWKPDTKPWAWHRYEETTNRIHDGEENDDEND